MTVTGRIPRSFPERFPIFQMPNRTAIVAFTAAAVARRTSGRLARDAAVVSNLASLVWAHGEITDGANWARRLFGIAGGTYAVARLVNQASRSAARSDPVDPAHTGAPRPR